MLVGDSDYKRILGGPNSRLVDNIKLDTNRNVQDKYASQQDLEAASVNTVLNI